MSITIEFNTDYWDLSSFSSSRSSSSSSLSISNSSSSSLSNSSSSSSFSKSSSSRSSSSSSRSSSSSCSSSSSHSSFTPIAGDMGFGRYSNDPYPNDLFLRYNNYATYVLTDLELRTLIKLKIIYNNKYSSLKNIKEALFAAFNGDIDVIDASIDKDYTSGTFWSFTRYSGTPAGLGLGRYSDNPYPSYLIYRYAYYRNMFLYYQVNSKYKNAFEAAVFLNIVPRPMAVNIQVNYV